MATLKPYSPYIYNTGRLLPANLYSRPAMPVFFPGANTAYNNVQQYKYTLQQMAVSPFSVNNETYIQRIRDEYDIANTGLYNSLGTIGSVVGAGVAVGLNSGRLRIPIEGSLKFWDRKNWFRWELKKPTFSLTNPYTGETNFKNKAFKDKLWSRAQRMTQQTDTGETVGSVFRKYQGLVSDYNKANTELLAKIKELRKQGILGDGDINKEAVEKLWRDYAYRGLSKDEGVIKAREAAKDLRKLYNTAEDAARTANATGDILRAADLGQEVVSVGVKATATGLGNIPVAGLSFDLASAGISYAGLRQSIEVEDPELIAWNAAALGGDTLSIIGDVFKIGATALGTVAIGTAATGVGVIPATFMGLGAGTMLAVGQALDTIGSIVSLGASAIVGHKVGRTVGRSLSPEGIKAQQLFGANLYSSVINRPITTVASTLMMFGLPRMLNKMTSGQGTMHALTKGALQRPATWLTTNAVGNQFRAGLSMMGMQLTSPITQRVEDALGWGDKDPEDVNFVSAISIYGDINDNLYGATRNKAILLGLAEGDPNAMVEAVARSWGEGDEIYRSVMFDDIREAVGIDASPIGNSIISTVGELLIDPQNFNEVYQRAYESSTTAYLTAGIERYVNGESARLYISKNIAQEQSIIKPLLNDAGILNPRLNQMERRVRIQRLTHAYLTKGVEGLRDTVDDIAKSLIIADSQRGQYYSAALNEQIDAVVTLFKNIFEDQTFSYGNLSREQIKDLRDNYKAYKKVLEKEANELELTLEEAKLKDHTTKAFIYLRNKYGNDMSEPAIFKKFLDDMGQKITLPRAVQTYTEYVKLRNHMDNVDALAGVITRVANPVMTGMKMMTHMLDTYLEKTAVESSLTKQAKTTTTIKELKNTINTIYNDPTTSEIKNRGKKVSDILDKPFEDNIDITVRKSLEGDSEVAAEAEAQRANAETVKTHFEEIVEYMEKRADVYDTADKHNPTPPRYIFEHDNGKKVEVSKHNIEQLKQEVQAEEHLYVQEKRYDQQTDVEKLYHAKRGAISMYEYTINHYDMLKDIIRKARSIIIDGSHIAASAEEAILTLSNAMHIFRKLSNITTQTPILLSGAQGVQVQQDMDVERYLLDHYAKNKEDVNEIIQFLSYYGFDVTFNYTLINPDGSKEKRTAANLSTLPANASSVENMDVNLVYKETPEQAILGAIKDVLEIPDMEAIMKGALTYRTDVTKDEWMKAEDDHVKQFNLLMRMLNNSELVTPDVLHRLRSSGKMDALRRRINSIFEHDGMKVLNMEQTNYKYIMMKMREIVMFKMFNDIKHPMYQAVKQMGDAFKDLQITIETLETVAPKNYAMIKFILENEMKVINRNFARHPIYKFLSAYLYPHGTGDGDYTNMFISPLARTSLAVKMPSTKGGLYKNGKTFRDTVSILVNQPTFQEIFGDKQIKEQAKYIMESEALKREIKRKEDKGLGTTSERERLEKLELPILTREKLKQNRARRAKAKRVKEGIRAGVDSTIKDSKNGLELLNEINTTDKHNIVPVIDILKIFGEAKTESDALQGILGKIFMIPITEVVYNIKQSTSFLLGSTSRADLERYYDVLNKEHRKSLGHHLKLVSFFNELIYLRANDSITLDLSAIRLKLKALGIDVNKYEFGGASKEVAALIAAYANGLDLHIGIKVDMKQFLRFKKQLYTSTWSAIEKFMIRHANHPAFAEFTPTATGGPRKSSVDTMAQRIIGDDTKTLFTEEEYKEIWELAKEDMIEDMVYRPINSIHSDILDSVRSIQEYERLDIRGLGDQYLTLVRSLAKKEIISNENWERMIDDILEIAKVEYFDNDPARIKNLNLDAFKVLYMLNSHIILDRSKKSWLRVDMFEDHYIDDDGNYRIVYKTKSGKLKEYTMSQLMALYNVTPAHLTTLHINLSANKSPEETTNIKGKMVGEFTALTHKYGGMLTPDYVSIGKKDYINKRKEEDPDVDPKEFESEYEILMDEDSNYLYNMLTLKDLYNTHTAPARGTDTDGNEYQRKSLLDNIKPFLSKDVFKLYQESSKDLGDGNIRSIVVEGKKIDKPKDLQSVFVLKLMASKIPEDTKKRIIRNVFFYQQHVLKGNVLMSEMDYLQDRVRIYKGIRNKAKDNGNETERLKAQQAIDDISLRLKAYGEILPNIEGIENENFDTFYKYLKDDPTHVTKIISQTYQGTDKTKFVIAKHNDTYVVVRLRDEYGNYNVDTSDVKGLPTYNYIIGEYILDVTEPESVKDLDESVKKALEEDAITKGKINLDRFELVEVGPNGALVVAEELSYVPDAVKYTVRDVTGINNSKNVYVVTAKQYQEIKDMKQSGEYRNVYDYKTIIENGKIKGIAEPNMINTKSAKTKIQSYLNDLSNILTYVKDDVNKIPAIVEKFDKYSRLRDSKPFIDASRVGGPDYTQTKDFKALAEQALKEKMFIDFMKHIDKSKVFAHMDIDSIGRLFFKEEFIMVRADGTFHDLKDLDLTIRNPEVRAEYSKRKGAGGHYKLLTDIRRALVYMQKTYGRKNISFEYNNIMNKGFTDRLIKIEDITSTFVKDLSYVNNSVYERIYKPLAKQHRRGTLTEMSANGMRNLWRVLKTQTNITEKHNILYPYDDWSMEEFNNLIKDLRYNFRSTKGEYNIQHILNVYTDNVHNKDIEENKRINRAKRYGKGSINFTRFRKEVTKYIEDDKDATKLLKKIGIKSFEVPDTVYKYFIDSYNSAVKIAQNPGNHDVGMVESATAYVESWLRMMNKHGKGKKNFNKIVANYIVKEYLSNIRTQLYYKKLPELLGEANKLIAGTPEITLQEMVDKLSAKYNKARKEGFKKAATDFMYVYTGDPDAPRTTVMGQALHELFPGIFSVNSAKNDVIKLYDIVEDVMDRLGKHVFEKDKTIVRKNLDVKFNKTTKEFNTVPEYLDSLKDEEYRDFTELVYELFILNKQYPGMDVNDVLKAQGKKTRITKEKPYGEFDPDVFTTIYNIFRKTTNKPFGSRAQMYRQLNIPLLDDIPKFKQFVYEYIFAPDNKSIGGKPIRFDHAQVEKEVIIQRMLNVFGLDYNKVRTLFEGNNLNLGSIVAILKDDIKDMEHTYAFIMLLNTLKIEFLRKNLKDNFSWYKAYNMYRTKAQKKILHAIKDAHDTHLFATEYEDDTIENSLLRGVHASLGFISDALKYNDRMNNELGMVRVPPSTTIPSKNTLQQQYIRSTQTNINRALLKEQNELYSWLFKPTTEENLQATLRFVANNALGDVQIHSMQERNAKDVMHIGSRAGLYSGLNRVYTELLRSFYEGYDSKKFILVSEIAYAYKIMLQNPHMMGVYEAQFNKYYNLLPVDLFDMRGSTDAAIEEIIKFTSEHSNLREVNERFVKAVFGFIYVQRYITEDGPKLKAFKKETNEFLTLQQDTEHEAKVFTINKLSNILSTLKDVDEMIDYMYPPELWDTLEPQEQKEARDLINQMRELTNILNTKMKLTEGDIFDMYEVALSKTEGAVVDKELTKIGIGELENEILKLVETVKAINEHQKDLQKEFGFHHNTSTNEPTLIRAEVSDRKNALDIATRNLQRLETTITAGRREFLLDIFLNTPALIHKHVTEQRAYAISMKEKHNKELEKARSEFSKKFLQQYDDQRNGKELDKRIMNAYWKSEKKKLDKAYTIYNKQLRGLRRLIADGLTLYSNDPDLKYLKDYKLEEYVAEYMKDLRELFTKTMKRSVKIQQDFIKNPTGILSEEDQKKATAIIEENIRDTQAQLDDELKYIKGLLGVKKITQQAVDAYIRSLGNDQETINAFKDLYQGAVTMARYIKTQEKALDNISKIPKSLTEMLRTVIDHYFTKEEIKKTDTNILIERVLSYMENTKHIKEARKDYKEAEDKFNQTKFEYDDAVSKAERLTTYIDTNPSKLEQLEKNKRDIRDRIDVLTKRVTKYQNQIKTKQPYRNTNFGTYLNLHPDARIKDDNGNIDETAVLNYMLDKAQSIYDGNLRADIANESIEELGIHNSIVDGLFTMMNAIKHYGKQMPEEAIAFDIETLKDETGAATPYQMTLIKYKNGKISILNNYLSNHVFFEDKENTPNGRSKALQGFFDQRYDMAIEQNPALKGQRNIVDQATKKFILKLKPYKNDITLITTFINEVSGKSKDVPLITHNGKRFDMYVYNNWLRKISRTLLTNLHYRVTEQLTPEVLLKSIAKKLETSSKTEAQLFAEATQNVVQRVHSKIANNEEITTSEVKMLYKLQMRSLNLIAKQAQDKIEAKIGYKYYADLRNKLKEETKYIQERIFKYIISSGTDQQQVLNEILEYYKQGALRTTEYKDDDIKRIEKYVTKELLPLSKNMYDEILEKRLPLPQRERGYVSPRSIVEDAVNEHIKNKYGDDIEELARRVLHYEDDFIPADYIDSVQARIDALENARAYLESGAGTDPKIRMQEIINEQVKVTEQINKVEGEIEAIQKIIDNLGTSAKDSLDKMYKASKLILRNTVAPAHKAMVSLKRKYRQDLANEKDAAQHRTNLYVLHTIAEETEARIQTLSEETERLVNYIKANATEKKLMKDPIVLENLKSTLDPDILTLKNETQRKDKIKEYQTEIDRLTELDASMQSGKRIAPGSPLYKYLQDVYKKVDKDLNKSLKENLKRIVKYWNRYAQTYVPRASKVSMTSINRALTKNLEQMRINLRNQFDTHKRDSVYQEMLLMLSKDSNIRKLINVLDKKSTLYSQIQTYNITDVIRHAISKRIIQLERYKDAVNDLTKPKSKEQMAIDIIQTKTKEMLGELLDAEDTKRLLHHGTIINAIQNGEKPLRDKTPSDIIKDAPRFLTADEKQKFHVPDYVRVYKSQWEGDDYEGLGLSPDYVYYQRNRNRIRVMTVNSPNYFGKVFHQEYSFNIEYPQYIEWKLTYFFSTKAERNTEQTPKTIPIKFDASKDNPDDIMKKLFTYKKGKKMERGYTGLSAEQVFIPKGFEDQAKASIQQLINHYKTWKKKGLFPYFDSDEVKKDKQKTKHAKVLEQFYKGDTVRDREFEGKHFERYNLSTILNQRFYSYLDMIQDIKDSNYRYDMNEVYDGLARMILSSYVTFDKSRLFNMVPPEMSKDFLIQFAPDDVSRLDIDLAIGAEGSAAIVTAKKSALSVPMLHTQNLNGFRDYLSRIKRVSDYTPSILINKLLDDYYDGSTKKSFEEVVIDHIINEKDTTKRKHLQDMLMRTYKDDKGKTKYINMFTPDNLTAEEHEYYKEDVYHKIGMNMRVGFMENPGTHEDTIMMDKSVANAIMHQEGFKTWVDFAGFKGSVILVPNLKDRFGVDVIANAKSIKTRNTNNLIIKQISTVLKYYLINQEYITKKQKNILDKVFNTKSKKDKLRKLLNITDGKIVGDPGKDYDKLYHQMFNGTGYTHYDLTETQFKTNMIIETVNSSGRITPESTYNFKGYNMYKGELYILLDPKNTADKMYTESEMLDLDGLNVPREDLKNNSIGGVEGSPTVTTAIKLAGVDFERALLDDDRYTKEELYGSLLSEGFDVFLKDKRFNIKMSKDKTKYDINKIIERMEKELPNALIENYRVYLHNLNMASDLTDVVSRASMERRIKHLENVAKTRANEALTGRSGTIYRSDFHKHTGVRAQLLTDTKLNQGTAVLPRKAWKQLEKMPGFFQGEAIERAEWEVLLSGFTVEYARNLRDNKKPITSKKGTRVVFDTIEEMKDFITYLHSRGITEDTMATSGYRTRTKKDGTKDYVLDFTKFERKVGYLWAARSPVQGYKAIPMIKVIGYNNHSNINMAPHVYGLMNADNDGDTAGFAALSQTKMIKDKHGVEKTQKEFFDPLDATKDEFYERAYHVRQDDGSFKKTESYLEGVRKNIRTDNTKEHYIKFTRVGIKESSASKNTFAQVRANNDYSWGETFKDISGLIAEDIHGLKVNIDAYKTWDEPTRRYYMNVAIKDITKGNNFYGSIQNKSDYFKNNGAKVLTAFQSDGVLRQLAAQHHAFDQMIEAGTYDPFKYITVSDVLNHKDQLSVTTRKTIKRVTPKKIIEDYTTNGVKSKYANIVEEIGYAKAYLVGQSSGISRSAMSKRGTSIMGSGRKVQYAGSYVSFFGHINEVPTRAIWNTLLNSPRALNPLNVLKGITSNNDILNDIRSFHDHKDGIESIASYDEFRTHLVPTNILTEVYERFDKQVTEGLIAPEDAQYYKNLVKEDLEDVLKDMYNQVYYSAAEYYSMHALADVLKAKNHNKIIEYYEVHHPEMLKAGLHKAFYNSWKKRIKKGDITLTNIELHHVLTMHFTLNSTERKQYTDMVATGSDEALDRLINKLANTYVIQDIIDRVVTTRHDVGATDIISVSKHGDKNMDLVHHLDKYQEKIEAEKEEFSKRKVTSTKDPNFRFAYSLAADKALYKELAPEFSDAPSTLDEYDTRTFIKDVYVDANVAKSDLINTIEESAMALFFNTTDFPEEIYTSTRNIIEAIASTIKESGSLDVALQQTSKVTTFIKGSMQEKEYTLEELFGLLEFYGIPSYKLRRFYERAFSNYLETKAALLAGSRNKLLTKETVPYIENGTQLFFELMKFRNFDYGATFKENYENEYPYTVAFFLNKRDMDIDYTEFYYDNNITSYKDGAMNRLNRYQVQELISESLQNTQDSARIEEYITLFKSFDEYQQQVMKNIIQDLNLSDIYQHPTMYEILKTLVKETKINEIILNEKQAEIQNADKNVVSSTHKRMNKDVYGYHVLSRPLRLLSQAYNLHEKTTQALAEAKQTKNELEQKRLSLLDEHGIDQTSIDFLRDSKDPDELIKLIKKQILKNKDKITTMKEIIATAAMSKEFARGIPFIHTPTDKTYKDSYKEKPRIIGQSDDPKLKEEDLRALKATNALNLQRKQRPFLMVASQHIKNTLPGEKVKLKDGTVFEVANYDWDEMYEAYKRKERFARITVVQEGYATEGRLRKIYQGIQKVDGEDNTKAFESFEEAVEYLEKMGLEPDDKIMIGNKVYSEQDLRDVGLELGKALSPTLKMIEVHGPQDLKAIYEFIIAYAKQTGRMPSIGFVDLNDWMSAKQDVYNFFSYDGKAARLLSLMQYAQKLGMRLSYGFLFRNYLDTWAQLYSEMYQQRGLYGVSFDTSDITTLANKIKPGRLNKAGILQVMGMTNILYDMYRDISEERLLSLIGIDNNYKQIQHILNNTVGTIRHEDAAQILQNILSLREVLQNYLQGVGELDNTHTTKQLEFRKDLASTYMEKIDAIINDLRKNVLGTNFKTDQLLEKVVPNKKYKYKDIDGFRKLHNNVDLKKISRFFLRTTFAEYFTLYDSLKFGKDKTQNSNKYRKRIEHWRKRFEVYKDKNGKSIYNANYDDVQHILFEISAFMQTNAQIDTYRQEHFTYLKRIIEQRRANDFQDITERSYEELSKEVSDAKRMFSNKIAEMTYKGYRKFYADWNEHIENTARIGGYLMDRYLYHYSFNETVNRSLKRWFNYGQRSPLETQLITDIPYLSFPVRSIDNWINRFFDPSYQRVLSDIVDGVYGQYADEDGQYDPYEQFMVQNGWVPISKNFGLRLGFGLYDVQNIVTDPYSAVLQRRNPILRGLAKLMETKDVTEALKQLAVVGVLTRSANTLGPRNAVRTVPGVQDFIKDQPRTIGNTFNFTFNYTNYENTPYKYRYQNKNGRYKRYENIYRQWFTKYGKMRKPPVDPLSLVKDIQWKQYVRYRQSRNMLYYR